MSVCVYILYTIHLLCFKGIHTVCVRQSFYIHCNAQIAACSIRSFRCIFIRWLLHSSSSSLSCYSFFRRFLRFRLWNNKFNYIDHVCYWCRVRILFSVNIFHHLPGCWKRKLYTIVFIVTLAIMNMQARENIDWQPINFITKGINCNRKNHSPHKFFDNKVNNRIVLNWHTRTLLTIFVSFVLLTRGVYRFTWQRALNNDE